MQNTTKQMELDLAHLCDVLGWECDPRRIAIRKIFQFVDFVQAFAFMQEMAIVSEQINHHPEWFNVYNRVDVKLTTHDVGGLSSLDMAWAKSADLAYQRCGGLPS